jgi:hypothetical protein
MKIWRNSDKVTGLCAGCKIRKQEFIRECDSCGVFLCSQCIEAMHKELRRVNERFPKVQEKRLFCRGCGEPWGYGDGTHFQKTEDGYDDHI